MKPAAVWHIKDAHGETQALHVRFDTAEGKECRWRLPRASGWGLDGRKVSTLPLYGCERLKGWPKDETVVVVVEGEKAADALLEAGFRALGTVTGASGTPHSGALSVLEGREVVLWPDADDQGRAHMERVAEALQGVASEVRVFTWHDAPEDVKGADAADHPALQGEYPEAADRLLQDLMEAPRYEGVTASQTPIVTVTPVTPLRFAEMEPPGPREHLVEGIVPKDHVTTLFGDGGAAKSVLALSLGTAIAGRTKGWLGREVGHFPVLFADFELDADEQRRRAYQVARGGYLEKPPHDLLYVSGLGQPAAEVLAGCLEVCVREGVGLLIVDSLGIALAGDAESAHDVIRFHREHLDPFRAAGVTLLVIDHQGKTQAGERYQSKRTFGSVYKENLARSVLQVEPGERGDGLLTLKVRQTKHNFGPKANPFGARLAFTEEKITVDAHELEDTELAEESTLNASDRVLLALKDGPAYPADAAEACVMPLGTVKNELTRLRKRGLVEYTGEIDPRTRAKEVRLTAEGHLTLERRGVTASQSLNSSVTPVTPEERERERFVL